MAPDDLANTVFDAGTAGGSDLVYAQLQLNDGSLTGWQPFTMATSSPIAGAKLVSVEPASLPIIDGSMPAISAPAPFTGQLIGFTGDGILAGLDKIDLHEFTFNSIHSISNATTGSPSVSDGSTTPSLQFLGHFSQDNFHFADGDDGGTIPFSGSVASPPSQVTPDHGAVATSVGEHDTFVFAPNFGHVTVASCAPAVDTIQFNKPVFANIITTLLAATHDDASG
ncbi:MAG: hypothetical protein ACREDL_09955, partial [Bradyrhizobium sp.]